MYIHIYIYIFMQGDLEMSGSECLFEFGHMFDGILPFIRRRRNLTHSYLSAILVERLRHLPQHPRSRVHSPVGPDLVPTFLEVNCVCR